jgi:hypothetical protein
LLLASCCIHETPLPVVLQPSPGAVWLFQPSCCHSFIDVRRQASSTSLTYSTAVASVAP